MAKTDETARRKSIIEERRTDIERWSDPANLEKAWAARSRAAAAFVPAGARVLDIGCGAMTLEECLPFGCVYLPSDVVARDDRTMVADLNAGDLPKPEDGVDIITCLGVVEYLYEPAAFLASLKSFDAPVVMSYCASDMNQLLDRRGLGWVNDLTAAELRDVVGEAGYDIRLEVRIDANQSLFRLEATRPESGPRRRVGVLSYNNVGNFGDRLGFHLLNQIMPAQADVVWLNHRPWNAPERLADQPLDVLVLGIGNSLFGSLLSDDLLGLLDATPRKIGIFGTQYREITDPDRMSAVIDRLDIWCARYEEDALIYGRGRDNVRHLGDWLIAACAMATPSKDGLLKIGDEIKKDLPLDRAIQQIQAYSRVFSTRLHPLLCALTSAEQVGYVEQREHPDNPKMAAGKFRSMLLDVFGVVYPEQKMFPVDHAAVATYRSQVLEGLDGLSHDLDKLVRGA